jgi:RNA polymerase-binding transcription factor DksA
MPLDPAEAARLLDDERRRIEAARASVGADITEEEYSAELADYDQHQADQGTEVFELSRDLGLREDFDQRLAEVDDASRRLDEGRYGICERCGRPIDEERLRAMPSARYCREDQAALGRSG